MNNYGSNSYGPMQSGEVHEGQSQGKGQDESNYRGQGAGNR